MTRAAHFTDGRKALAFPTTQRGAQRSVPSRFLSPSQRLGLLGLSRRWHLTPAASAAGGF